MEAVLWKIVKERTLAEWNAKQHPPFKKIEEFPNGSYAAYSDSNEVVAVQFEGEHLPTVAIFPEALKRVEALKRAKKGKK